MEPSEFNPWASKFLWPFNLPSDCPAWDQDPASDACEAWIRAFQEEHRLRVDGLLGPNTIHAFASTSEGTGVGGLVIGGQEFDIGIPVARMGTITMHQVALPEPPRLGCLLAIKDVERTGRAYREGKKPIRAHFTIDASQGRDGLSMILQWADPLCEVPFAPSEETEDYPAGRLAVGVELENPMVKHGADSEMRKWLRRRDMVKAVIAEHNTRQMDLFPEQVGSLVALVQALSTHVGIPHTFPHDETGFDILLTPTKWSDYDGWLAQFHYKNRLGAPGAGLVHALPAVFPELAPDPEVADANPTSKGNSFGPNTSRPVRAGDEQEAFLAAATIAAPSTAETEARSGERDAAWDVGAASAIQPKGTQTKPFSLSGSLRRRSTTRSSRSRANALADRFKPKD